MYLIIFQINRNITSSIGLNQQQINRLLKALNQDNQETEGNDNLNGFIMSEKDDNDNQIEEDETHSHIKQMAVDYKAPDDTVCININFFITYNNVV